MRQELEDLLETVRRAKAHGQTILTRDELTEIEQAIQGYDRYQARWAEATRDAGNLKRELEKAQIERLQALGMVSDHDDDCECEHDCVCDCENHAHPTKPEEPTISARDITINYYVFK